MSKDRIPTTEKLAVALEIAGAPVAMIELARKGHYDDYKSDLGNNLTVLVRDARAAGLHDIAQQAIDGDFDAQDWETDEWAMSPEGQETFRVFGMRQ